MWAREDRAPRDQVVAGMPHQEEAAHHIREAHLREVAAHLIKEVVPEAGQVVQATDDLIVQAAEVAAAVTQEAAPPDPGVQGLGVLQAEAEGGIKIPSLAGNGNLIKSSSPNSGSI